MTYKNGNTIVEIKEDGTKIRYVPDNVPALPEYPESIDMKICNRCEVGCPSCHECSTPNGKLGKLSNRLLNSLHLYTEIAIGGGDPLSHPDLPEFLTFMKVKQVYANITVHWKSFMKNLKTLHSWADDKLIYGLGVSINEEVPEEVITELIKFPNLVVHTIIGISTEKVYRQLKDKNLNILLLGYKTFGRGIRYRTNNSAEIAENTIWIKNHLEEVVNSFRAVSFDNLAIDQLELKKKLKQDIFNQIYMGNDGSFTMYVDLVENQYAVSSTSKRYDIDNHNIDILFQNVRRLSNA